MDNTEEENFDNVDTVENVDNVDNDDNIHTTNEVTTNEPTNEEPLDRPLDQQEDARSDATSEPPAAGEFFDLRDFFFDEAEEQNAAEASSTEAPRTRRRRRRRDTFVLVEDLPEGVDFDEPVEVERMTRAGKIMNLLVSVAFLAFLIMTMVVLGNMAMTVMVVFYPPWPEAIEISAYNLDQPVAALDFNVKMPGNFYTRFLSFSKEAIEPLKVEIFLPLPKEGDSGNDQPTLTEEDRVCTLFYDDSKPENSNKKIAFDGFKGAPITAEGVELKFNPVFDASRLGLLLEDKKHPQRPKRIYAKISVDILIRHLMMPITITYKDFVRHLDLDQAPNLSDPKTKMQADVMSSFNFLPREIQFSTSEDQRSVQVQLAQPLPNCLMGSGMKISALIPAMDFEVYEFSFKDPKDRMKPFSFDAISKIYKHLADVKTQSFVFQEALVNQMAAPALPATKDRKGTPAQLAYGEAYPIEIAAKLDEGNLHAVNDVLAAIRDGKTENLTFLVKSKGLPDPDFAAESVNFTTFMRKFWVRYPYPKSDPNKPFPALPEEYDKTLDAALQVHFVGVSEGPQKELEFHVSANTFYIISQYGLPVSLLGGQIPAISFDLNVKKKQSTLDSTRIVRYTAATIRMENFTKDVPKRIGFDIKVKLHDLSLASLFAVKFMKYKEMISASFPKARLEDELQRIDGAELVAKKGNGTGPWFSELVSAFNMDFNFNSEGSQVVYKASQVPVVAPKAERSAEDQAALCQARRVIRDELLNELKINLRDGRLDHVTVEQEERIIREFIKTTDISPEKYNKVRPKLQRYLSFNKNCPLPVSGQDGKASLALFNNDAKVEVRSEEADAEVDFCVQLHRLVANSPVYEDRIDFSWNQFDLALLSASKNSADKLLAGALFTLSVKRGRVGFLMQSGRLFAFDEEAKLEARLALKTDQKSRQNFLKRWTDFFFALMEGRDRALAVPVFLRISEATWPLSLPSVPLLTFKDTTAASKSLPDTPGFFENLARTLIDFTGYGQFSLLFNAVWPNPRDLSFFQAEGTVWNLDLMIPDTSIYLFSDVKRESLVSIESGPVMTGSLLSKRYLARIVDGRLESVFTVGAADKHPQKSLQYTPSDSKTILDNFKVPSREHNRLTILKVATVELKIINFGRIIKFVDHVAQNTRVHLGAGNPLTAQKEIQDTSQEIRLWSAWLSVLASKWQVVLNDRKAVEEKIRRGPKRIDVSQHGVMKMRTAVSSPDPFNLSAHINLSLPAESTSSLPAQGEAFQHPIIRWGAAEITFAFSSNLRIRLALSPGNIQVAEGGGKILFGALSNFDISLDVSTQPSEQVPVSRLKKLYKEYKKSSQLKSSVLSSATIRELFFQLAQYTRDKQFVYETHSISELIRTRSKVSYKDGETYAMGGFANTHNFFELFRVIVQRMFAPGPADAPQDPSTQVDFSMLVRFDPRHEKDLSCIPKVIVPCFMTNFCSARQVTFSPLSRAAHYEDKPIPVQLHVRNVFQPLTAAIAKGMASFLTVFHFDSFPPGFEWELSVEEAQVAGVEINGQALIAGRVKPFVMKRSAQIPYANTELNPIRLTKSSNLTQAHASSDRPQKIQPETFDAIFFPPSKPEFNDVFVFEAEAILPDTFATVLRKMFSVLFVPGATPAIGLHPPLLDPNAPTHDRLFHAPICVALSNAVTFADPSTPDRHFLPSLAAGLFTAFMEESSSGGIDAHTPTTNSTVRMEYSLSASEIFSTLFAGKDASFSVWLRFPWPMGPVGFDYGGSVNASLRKDNEEIGSIVLARHYFEGKIAYFRMDFILKAAFIRGLLGSTAYSTFLTGWGSWLTTTSKAAASLSLFEVVAYLLKAFSEHMKQMRLSMLLNVNDDFLAESEITLPLSTMFKEADSLPTRENVSFQQASKPVPLTNFQLHQDAISCIFNEMPDSSTIALHKKRWSRLNLAKTRFFYTFNGAHRRNIPYRFALQLRTADHRPVCGSLSYTKVMRVVFVYEQPLLRLRSVLGSFVPPISLKDCAHCRVEAEAALMAPNSVYLTRAVQFMYPGRYSIFVQFKGRGELVKLENAEVYIINPR